MRAEQPGDAARGEVEGDQVVLAEAGEEPAAGHGERRHLRRRRRVAGVDDRMGIRARKRWCSGNAEMPQRLAVLRINGYFQRASGQDAVGKLAGMREVAGCMANDRAGNGSNGKQVGRRGDEQAAWGFSSGD